MLCPVSQTDLPPSPVLALVVHNGGLPRISSRLPASLGLNEFTLAVERLRCSETQLLDLTVSNPTATLPAYPHPQIAAALGAIETFAYAPDPFGMRGAREAVAAYYVERGFAVSPDRIALTASTSEAYSVLFKLLCDPGDEVLVPTPSYPLFEHLAAFESVRTVPYRLAYDGAWHVDFDHLRSAISPRSRAIVVVSPNNPTGSIIKHSEALQLSGLGLPIISDEVFIDYRHSNRADASPSFCTLPSCLSFSLNGLSKVAGMPQMKLGWMLVNGDPAAFASVRSGLEVILDTYLSVNTPVQAALPALLSIGSEVQQCLKTAITRNLACARDLLAQSPLTILDVEGGWSLILQLPATRSEEEWLFGILNHCRVVVQPGFFFDMPRAVFIVVSLITPPDDFQTALLRIRDYVQSQ